MPFKSKWTTQSMLQAAKKYLAQTKAYEALTLQNLADFLGVNIQIINRWLPIPQWEQLRCTWIRDQIKQTIEILYTKRGNREEITIKDIASQAAMPFKVIRDFLPESEWQTQRTPLAATGGQSVVQEPSSTN